MSDEQDHEWEAIERDLAGEEDDQPSLIICKLCRTSGLHWENDNGRWRLLTKSGMVHVCPKQAPVKRL